MPVALSAKEHERKLGLKAPDGKLVILVSLMAGLLIISNVIVAKMVWVFGIYIPVAFWTYALTFLFTDTINDVYGKKIADHAVIGGFITQLVVLFAVVTSMYWRAAPFWQNQDAYMTVLGLMPRIVLASMVAYLVSQLHDNVMFRTWKLKTGGKHLWLRNNLSTWQSQFIDSMIFFSIAFYGVFPLFPTIIFYWLLKCVVASLDTILIYPMVAWARK